MGESREVFPGVTIKEKRPSATENWTGKDSQGTSIGNGVLMKKRGIDLLRKHRWQTVGNSPAYVADKGGIRKREVSVPNYSNRQHSIFLSSSEQGGSATGERGGNCQGEVGTSTGLGTGSDVGR